jgi:aryl-alcohol dehydrogenase-like predicted oxidoreductase
MFDAAEIYPVPPKPETQGRTEAIIGTWLAARGSRDKVMIATKVAGRGKMTWLRQDGAKTRHSEAQINEAVEASLRRLRTDYIDLYQLHWPDRPMRIFEGHDYLHLPGDTHPIDEILGVLAKLVASGKVRCIGLSNETPWGVMSFLKTSEQHGLPRHSVRAISAANMKAARCRRAHARRCSIGSAATRRRTVPGRSPAILSWRGGVGSTRHRWRSRSRSRAPS